jgi:hypothetical protein
MGSRFRQSIEDSMLNLRHNENGLTVQTGVGCLVREGIELCPFYVEEGITVNFDDGRVFY